MATPGVGTFNATTIADKFNPFSSKSVTSLQSDIAIFESRRAKLQTAIDEGADSQPPVAYIPYLNGGTTVPMSTAKALMTELIRNLANARAALTRAQASESKNNPGSGTGGSGSGTAVSVKYEDKVLMNAAAARENYFISNQTFWSDTINGKGAKRDTNVYASNTPSAVANARDLWKKVSGSKGMIQSWRPPGNLKFEGDWATPKSGKKIQLYAFQFMYNPDRVHMAYGGVADVDPTMMSSGKEEYLLSNPTVFKSSVDFTVYVNRMHDLKHLGEGGAIVSGLSPTDIWSGNIPTKNDLKRIYNYGTMYDIEFLLKSMLRFEFKSQLRNDMSSDFGYLGASPVELHLGNKLRYVVQISGIDVEHILFDNRMVPTFSKVTINATRMPDYAAKTIKDISK